jgi:Spy/CpxP family protein refolding chaperone
MKTLISSLCLLSIVFSTAFSQPGNPSHRKEGPQYNWADLGLTEDQKAKLKEIHEEMADARKENFEAVKALRVKIKEELLKNDPAKSMLDSYADELGKLHKEMSRARNEHLLKVKKILTAEQFSKVVNKEWLSKKGKTGHKGKWKKSSANCGMQKEL